MYKIQEKRALNKDIDYLLVEAPRVAKHAAPGHFVLLRVDEEGERIPLTIVGVVGQAVALIVQKVGYTTKQIGQMQVGDAFLDFMGPLGNAVKIDASYKRVLGVAGGVGAAPLLPQLRAYHEAGVQVDLLLGAKSKDLMILQEEFGEICEHIYLTSDDGSVGKKGFVTDYLEEVLKCEDYDHAIVIGPLIMMKYVSKSLLDAGIDTAVSLNPIMIDGTGMCGNCRVLIEDKTYFACIDGPDFPAKGIDFDLLMARQGYYDKEEHLCKIGRGYDEK
jgi:ferredoxin--NADP+ reductase